MVVVLIADTEFEFALLGAEHDRLAVHPPDHVERRLRLAAQGEFEEVLLHAGFERLAQLRLDLEEPVGGAHPLDALMRALVVVILDPELDALAGGLEGVELRPHEEVLPDGGPEALDLAERHRVMRPGLDVGHAVLLEFRLKAAGAPPSRVLAAVVSEHLLRWLILADGDAIHLDDRRSRGTAEQVRPHDEARVIIQEGDEVGVTAAEPEREDVRLPHLIGRGPLEEAGPDHVPLLGRRSFRHQLGLVQMPADGLGTGREEEPTAEPLTDALDAEARVLLLQGDDLLADGRRQFGFGLVAGRRLESGFAGEAIGADPLVQAALADVGLLADDRQAEAFLDIEPDGPELFGQGVAPVFRRAIPPRGDGRMTLLLLDYCLFIHVNTSFIIEVSTH